MVNRPHEDHHPHELLWKLLRIVATIDELVREEYERKDERKYEGLHMFDADPDHFHIKSNRFGEECRYYNFNDFIQQLPINQSFAPGDC